MRQATLAAALLLAACSGGADSDPPIDAADAAIDAIDGGGCGDCDAPDPDAPPPACPSLVLRTRPVRAVAFFEAEPRLHAGRSFRVQIEYDAAPCDQLAMPSWRIGAANSTVAIQANVFTSPEDCPGLPRRETRVITLRLEAGTWRLLGTGAAVPPQLMVTVGPAPLLPCAPGAPGSCLQDCDCLGTDRCLSGQGVGGPFLSCATPCELDRDCGGGQCTSIPDGHLLTCDTTFAECGGPGQSCPTGFVCAGGTCAPDFVLTSSARHECTCDSDCAAPLRCVQPTVPGRTARCEIPCPSGGAWCQGAHACGPASQDVSGLAPSDSVCGWLGD